jgi:hypothetical protein
LSGGTQWKVEALDDLAEAPMGWRGCAPNEYHGAAVEGNKANENRIIIEYDLPRSSAAGDRVAVRNQKSNDGRNAGRCSLCPARRR